MRKGKKMTTATETRTVVTKIAIEDIDKTYNGDQGCACGCGGEYIDADTNHELAAKHLARINARLKSNASQVDVEWNYAAIEGVNKALRVYYKAGVRYTREMFTNELVRIEMTN